ncbi:chromosome-associated kinesin KIF4-like [Homarus americanus]|uniref:Chromosome-associated kinesin KIF4-like n=1 Tax=Homarus americanus TaxID=6706 RepID=A0A8J5ND49_HOMAM|nr:chromosome-associated kinesin KIF4-like [Homarus americanus]
MLVTPGTPQVCTGLARNASVKVYVRTRPMLGGEEHQGATNILAVSSQYKKVVVEDGTEKKFTFDDVFEEHCSQDEVYMRAVEPLVTKVEENENATVFAYGQTGSGKTFTMGTSPCFAQDKNPSATQGDLTNTARSLTISIMEVYNETVYDLLAPSRIPLKTKAGPGGAVSVVGVQEEIVNSVEEGLLLLKKGSHLRSVGATAGNQHSSRSHAIIYLILKLVDLAGAEGVGRTQMSGRQFTEGVNINKGLLALSKVLAALSNPTAGYVPYRESVLTRLLKDSLGGNSHTAMIACVSPANFNVHETIKTLHYAEQARNIRTKPQILSTIKRLGMKRRCEDVTATPEAWKRRIMASGKKPEHNSTISTPGHKPPSRVINEMDKSTLLGVSCDMPPPMFSSLIQQPVINESVAHPSGFSPLLERVSCLEMSMMTQLENIEDRLCNKIMAKLEHKKKGTCSRKKKRHCKSKSSTPNSDVENKLEVDSSDDDIMGIPTAGSLFDTHKMKSLLQDIVTSALGSHTVLPSNLPVKTAIPEISANQNPMRDIKKKSIWTADERALENCKETTMNMDSQPLKDLPVTSTAFVDTRAVRKSTRLSTRQIIQKALFKDLSPDVKCSSKSTSIMTEEGINTSFSHQFSWLAYDKPTVLQEEGSPLLRSPKLSVQPQSKEINREFKESHTNGAIYSGDITKYVDDIQSQTCSGFPVKLNFTLPLNGGLKPEKNNPRRKSTRLSAIRATQRNFEILQGQSPYSSVVKSRRPSLASTKKDQESTNVTMCVVPTNTTFSANDTTQGKWQLKVSPRLQKQHNETILKILNTGNLKKLQQLPTVGPKTAMVIHNFRLTWCIDCSCKKHHSLQLYLTRLDTVEGPDYLQYSILRLDSGMSYEYKNLFDDTFSKFVRGFM